jgi:transposase
MQGTRESRKRRVHGAEFKAKVVAQCKAAGASVAAVAQANGVDASVVRRWLNGQGLKRCAGLSPAAGGRAGQAAAQSAGTLQFVPVELAGLRTGTSPSVERGGGTTPGEEPLAEVIQVRLSRGDVSVQVQWPATRAIDCAAWLGELGAAVLK